MRRLVLAVGLALAGCGGDNDDEGANDGVPACAPEGSYTFEMFERTGNCGPVSPSVVTFNDDGTAQPNACTVYDKRVNGCEIQSDYSCPGQLPNGYPVVVRTIGEIVWAGNGETGSGVASVGVYDGINGAQGCSSVYDLLYTRI